MAAFFRGRFGLAEGTLASRSRLVVSRAWHSRVAASLASHSWLVGVVAGRARPTRSRVAASLASRSWLVGVVAGRARPTRWHSRVAASLASHSWLVPGRSLGARGSLGCRRAEPALLARGSQLRSLRTRGSWGWWRAEPALLANLALAAGGVTHLSLAARWVVGGQSPPYSLSPKSTSNTPGMLPPGGRQPFMGLLAVAVPTGGPLYGCRGTDGLGLWGYCRRGE